MYTGRDTQTSNEGFTTKDLLLQWHFCGAEFSSFRSAVCPADIDARISPYFCFRIKNIILAHDEYTRLAPARGTAAALKKAAASTTTSRTSIQREPLDNMLNLSGNSEATGLWSSLPRSCNTPERRPSASEP